MDEWVTKIEYTRVNAYLGQTVLVFVPPTSEYSGGIFPGIVTKVHNELEVDAELLVGDHRGLELSHLEHEDSEFFLGPRENYLRHESWTQCEPER